MVPEPPSAAGVGRSATTGELIQHALHVLQRKRRERWRRPARSRADAAAAARAFELCLNGRLGAACDARVGRLASWAEDRALQLLTSQMLCYFKVSDWLSDFSCGRGDLSLPPQALNYSFLGFSEPHGTHAAAHYAATAAMRQLPKCQGYGRAYFPCAPAPG